MIQESDMRYAIISNPVSGAMPVEQKRAKLSKVAKILDADILGLDTTSSDDFRQCAREIAGYCDVLVAAGGDGTLSDVINAIDIEKNNIAYLPLGTGNAMKHALSYKGELSDIAIRIKNGSINEYDLINCDNKKKAFMASVGIEADILRIRDKYLARGNTGLKSYFNAAIKSYFKEFKRTKALINLDGSTFKVDKLLSLMVVKQPYYGFGMNVVPAAQFNDGKLHVLYLNGGLLNTSIACLTAFAGGNRIGRHLSGSNINLKLEQPLTLQIDGNMEWESNNFNFQILPGALKIKC